MSAVPAEIAGIGSTSQKLRVSPGFDPLKAGVGPEEYFLLSRIDGTQTLRDVMLATGLPVDRAIAIVTRLRMIGALLLPDEGPPPAKRATTGQVPVTPPQPQPQPPPRTQPPGKPVARPPTGQVPITRPSSPVIPARTTTPPPFRLPDPGAPDPARAATRSMPTTPARPPTAESPVVRTPAPRAPTPPVQQPTAVSRAATPQGRAPTPPAARPTPITPPAAKPAVAKPQQEPLDTTLASPTADELGALSEHNDMSDVERRRVLAITRLIATRDPYAILGVPPGSDLKILKHAYFKLSKEIHPDRFFGKDLGSFADRLPIAFEAVARAYARLTTPDKTSTGNAQQTAQGNQPQTPQEYASELYDRATALEVGGDAMGAMKLFAAAVRLDPQVRFLRRAASCALAANQPRSAVEYAKKAQAKAPDDPSCARLLAGAFRAVNKLTDAEEVLVMAMALKSENDSLMVELRNDLAEVRRLIGG